MASSLDTTSMVSQVEEFLTDTQDARELSEKCRDYRDGKQWTPYQIAVLRGRKQAPIVNNRIKAKMQGLLGLVVARRTDPKAYPRTKKHEHAAEACTDALNYVSDNCDFDRVKMEVADNFFCEGYGASIIDVREGKDGKPEIFIDEIPWDRYYFDPKSRKRDFSDARFQGQMLWLDEAQIDEMFPDFDISRLTPAKDDGFETFADKPRWISGSGNRKRYRVAQHFYIEKGVWMMCIFSEDVFLVEPAESPYLDEFDQPQCPIEAVSAYIDRDNNRYGEVAAFLDLQDEINHRRSKGLFLLSQRQTFGTQGAITDVAKAKKELAKPDGHLEVEHGQLNKEFGVLPTGDMAQAQFDLLQEAKAEIDGQSYNAQLSGERQSGNLSGKAISKLQQAGVTELQSLYLALNGWELRVYRQVWSRIKQFWNEEKWIRVTDDYDNLRWVGLNSKVTMGMLLNETMEDESLPYEMRLGASAAMIQLEQENPEALNQLVETRNDVAELDVDIILDQTFHSINAQEEQLEMLASTGALGQMDIVDIVDIMNIRDKDELIERIEKRRQESAQAQSQALQAEQESKAQEMTVKNAKVYADAQLITQKANQTAIESQIMITRPDPTPQIIS